MFVVLIMDINHLNLLFLIHIICCREKPLGAYGGKSLSDFELDDDLESEFDITFPPDLLNPDPTLDLDEEYFSTEQVGFFPRARLSCLGRV